MYRKSMHLLQKRFYSISKQNYKLELVREFIFDSLYNTNYGYFSSKENLIFTKSQNQNLLIPFSKLEDQFDYQSHLSELYKQGKNSWSTPSELFQPFYAQGMMRYLIQQISKQQIFDQLPRIDIIEVGGGNGTFAKNALDYLQQMVPQYYSKIHYKIIEISDLLFQIQQQKLESHSSKVTLCRQNILDYLQTYSSNAFTIVILNEVIDNFPHDKVIFQKDKLLQIHVGSERVADGTEKLTEVEFPLQDPLIVEYLELIDAVEPLYSKHYTSSTFTLPNNFVPLISETQTMKQNFFKSLWKKSIDSVNPYFIGSFGGEKHIYVPTYLLQLFKLLHQKLPNHHLILTDFDYLPNEEPGCENAPTVQRKIPNIAAGNDQVKHLNQSFSTYLVPRGSCDIFFATNFSTMQRIYQKMMPFRNSMIMKHGKFFSNYLDQSDLQHLRTKSGYTPILEDYSNMSIFLT